jgi:hypothetical protein
MKTRLKYSILIIILILIFLGILWLKYNSHNKEGLDADSAAALSSDILSTVNSKLSAAGVDTAAYTAKIPDILDQVTQLINRESDAADDAGATGQGPPDFSAVVDTTGSDYYPSKTFFKGSKFSDGFCQSYTDPVELNNACSSLSTENCNQTDCCIVLNGSKCVAGNAEGPMYQTENGNDIDYAYYSYKNQCYGSCGKGLANAANPCAAYATTDTGISERCIKRLWSQSGCPNGAYINSDVVTDLKDHSKMAIQVKFKKARSDEPNYAECYGPNESRWPVPCNDTTDTSINLSARCLTKLFTDVGCTNTDTITSEYVIANNLEPKSAMINVFTDLTNAPDDSEGKLTKCYGSDESQWPDPCLDVSDTANLIDGTLPKRCAMKIFKEATKCPSTDSLSRIFSIIDSMTIADKNNILGNPESVRWWTKAGIAQQYSSQALEIQNNRFKCYGINPNKWPDDLGINKIIPDPCASLRTDTKMVDVPVACTNRLKGSDIFPTTNCSKGNAKLINEMVSVWIDNKYPDNLAGGSVANSEMFYNAYMKEWCKPDPPASGRLYGKYIKNNKESIPVVAAKYLNDGKTIVYLAYDGGYTKMVTNKGVARYYYGPLDNFDSVNWNTYSDAGDGYLYSQ